MWSRPATSQGDGRLRQKKLHGRGRTAPYRPVFGDGQGTALARFMACPSVGRASVYGVEYAL